MIIQSRSIQTGARAREGWELEWRSFPATNRHHGTNLNSTTDAPTIRRILKALELTNHIEIADNAPRMIGVYTDNRITFDSLKDASNHNYLIVEVRKQLTILRRTNWTIEFSWIKSHAGNPGNELADRLAKDVASNKNTPVAFDRIPKTTLYKELEDETIQKWQEQWDRCYKAAVTKQFFPNVRDRIYRTININPNFTALVTGHGKT